MPETEYPNIAYYEADEHGVEQLVQRPMTAAEYHEHQKIAKAEAQKVRLHPLIEQVQAMTPDERAELKSILDTEEDR